MKNELTPKSPEDEAPLGNSADKLSQLVEIKLGPEALGELEESIGVIKETLLEAILVIDETGGDVEDFQNTIHDFSEALFLRFSAENLDKRIGITSLRGATALMAPGQAVFPEMNEAARQMVNALTSRYSIEKP